MNASEQVNFTPIFRVQAIFEEYRKDLTTNKDKTAAVQAFKFCYELSWKLMKRILEARGFEVGAPKDIFRKAALDHLIEDPEVLFTFQKKRNLTGHAYSEGYLNEIVGIFQDFSRELGAFINKAQSMQ